MRLLVRYGHTRVDLSELSVEIADGGVDGGFVAFHCFLEGGKAIWVREGG